MSYKGQVQRGEKWFNLLGNTANADQQKDIDVYLAEVEKEKATKSKGKK